MSIAIWIDLLLALAQLLSAASSLYPELSVAKPKTTCLTRFESGVHCPNK